MNERSSPSKPSPTTGLASPDQRAIEETLLSNVVGSFDGSSDPRLRELMQALVRHLHALIREVRLTESEWKTAIEFLTNTGHITTENRQEFVELSDVLGASMQTIAVNNEAHANATEATVLGPFFVEGAPQIPLGGDIAGGAAGEPCWFEGTVTDTEGNPVGAARIDVWEADGDGFYDVQYPNGRVSGRAQLLTNEHGRYWFWGLTPTPYPIPHDGPVGSLLEAVGRSFMRAAHLHVMVHAENLRPLVTHIFVSGDDYLDRDAVFSVKSSLVRDFERQKPGTPTPDGRDLADQRWAKVNFDIVLAPADI